MQKVRSVLSWAAYVTLAVVSISSLLLMVIALVVSSAKGQSAPVGVKTPILCVPVDSAAPVVVTPAPTTTAPPAGLCNADGSPGPKFDVAGAKNVGNGKGLQFIGGQCLTASDCASGCCAKPCGICSGPGAQFQAGKQGCGFESPRNRLRFKTIEE